MIVTTTTTTTTPNSTPDPAAAESLFSGNAVPDPDPDPNPDPALALAYAARDALNGSDVSWRRLKRAHGKIYRWALRNLGAVVREALKYPSGLEGDYETEKCFCAVDGHALEGLAISKVTGKGWLPLKPREGEKKKEVWTGDLFCVLALALKLASREAAPEWLWALKKRMESKEGKAEETRRRFVERNENWNDKDLVWEVVGKKEWYGDTTRLARLLNDKLGTDETDEIDAGSVRRKLGKWLAPTSDVHRFVVTERKWEDERGWVNKRRYTLTPTGRDLRREEALAEANRRTEPRNEFESRDEAHRDSIAASLERDWIEKPEVYFP
jgi:hypothetical protein